MTTAAPASIPTESTISIVVPVHDGGADLRLCLASIAACRPAPMEVVVVDDASGDGSHAVAEEMGARCVRLPEQRGPAYARNRGAEQAAGEILFFVDADVALAPNAIAEAADAFRRQPGLAAVFGSYDDCPAAPNFLSQYKNLFHHYVHQTSEENAWTFWAGCGAVRREVFLAAGGFDETYRRPSIEDIELGGRLRRAGHEIRLRKSLQGKHLKRWHTASLLRSDIGDRALPWAALLLRTRSLASDLNLRWSSRVGAVGAGMLVSLLALAWWWPLLLLPAALLAAGLVALNAPLYAFFARKRGLGFALRCIPWHWLYLLYGGTAFVLAYAAHLRSRGRATPPTRGSSPAPSR